MSVWGTNSEGCNNCPFCCLRMRSDTPGEHIERCGTSIECDPYVYLRIMLPVLLVVSLLFLCIACCVRRRGPYSGAAEPAVYAFTTPQQTVAAVPRSLLFGSQESTRPNGQHNDSAVAS